MNAIGRHADVMCGGAISTRSQYLPSSNSLTAIKYALMVLPMDSVRLRNSASAEGKISGMSTIAIGTPGWIVRNPDFRPLESDIEPCLEWIVPLLRRLNALLALAAGIAAGQH